MHFKFKQDKRRRNLFFKSRRFEATYLFLSFFPSPWASPSRRTDPCNRRLRLTQRQAIRRLRSCRLWRCWDLSHEDFPKTILSLPSTLVPIFRKESKIISQEIPSKLRSPYMCTFSYENNNRENTENKFNLELNTFYISLSTWTPWFKMHSTHLHFTMF